MKCSELTIPVSSTTFNLKIIFLGSEEEITKGVAAKDFTAFAHSALFLESYFPLRTVQNRSGVISSTNRVTTIYNAPTMIWAPCRAYGNEQDLVAGSDLWCSVRSDV